MLIHTNHTPAHSHTDAARMRTHAQAHTHVGVWTPLVACAHGVPAAGLGEGSLGPPSSSSAFLAPRGESEVLHSHLSSLLAEMFMALELGGNY